MAPVLASASYVEVIASRQPTSARPDGFGGLPALIATILRGHLAGI